MTDETTNEGAQTHPEKKQSKAELAKADEAPGSLKEAREEAEAGRVGAKKDGSGRRTDHLAGAGPQYGEVRETGAEAFSRQHEEATGKHVAEIGIPTSSLDTANLAEVKGVLPQTGESMTVIGEAQEETANSGAIATAETAGVGDNAEEKAALRGSLPDDFPGVERLRAENLTSYGALRKYRGRFTQIDGIGEATEKKIREAAGLGEPADDKEPA